MIILEQFLISLRVCVVLPFLVFEEKVIWINIVIMIWQSYEQFLQIRWREVTSLFRKIGDQKHRRCTGTHSAERLLEGKCSSLTYEKPANSDCWLFVIGWSIGVRRGVSLVNWSSKLRQSVELLTFGLKLGSTSRRSNFSQSMAEKKWCRLIFSSLSDPSRRSGFFVINYIIITSWWKKSQNQ